MKATVKLYYNQDLTIDLEDYGHDETKTFEQLSESEKDEITDHLRDEVIVSCVVETIKP